MARAALIALLLSLFAPIAGVGAVERIVAVLSSEAPPYRSAVAALALALDGRAVLDIRLLDETRPEHLVQARVLVAVGSTAASALRLGLREGQALCYALVSDPGAQGLVGNGRISGISATVPFTDQFALLVRSHPACRRLGILHRGDRDSEILLKAATQALPAGWSIKAVSTVGTDLSAAIDAVTRDVDAIWTHADNVLFTDATVRLLLLSALRRRIAVFGFSPAFVRAGALIGVGIDAEDQGRRLAPLILRILDGEAATGIHLDPIAEIAVNLTVAAKLGLRLDEALVGEARHRFGDR